MIGSRGSAPACLGAQETEELQRLATGCLQVSEICDVITAPPGPRCPHLQNGHLGWTISKPWNQCEVSGGQEKERKHGGKKGRGRKEGGTQEVKGMAWVAALFGVFVFLFFGVFFDHNEKIFKPNVVLVTCSSSEWDPGVLIPP